MIKNLKDAKTHADKIKKGLIKNPLQDADSIDSLKEFAKVNDEENFRVIVDFLSEFISKSKKGGPALFRKEPLVFIEILTMILDHSDKVNYTLVQLSRGLKVKKPTVKKTQKFFHRLYGNHFFVK